MAQESPPSHASLRQLITDYPSAQVIHSAVQLGLADLLADGARHVADLATATGAHAPSLARLIRALAALGVVAEDADGSISLTSLGAPLCASAPDSLRDQVRFLTGEWFWRSWGDLLYSVQTGQPAFEHQFGMQVFRYWEQRPEARAIRNAFFAVQANAATAPLVAAYSFARFGTVVDVGGQVGPLLAGILQAYPDVRGVLFDLPFVVAEAAPVLASAGVAYRCEVVGGDFFVAVPAGADAYLLKSILHDWDDEHAAAVLTQCRVAMGAEATLLVIEQVLPERMETGSAAWRAAHLDLQMLALTPGGRERTVSDFDRLLSHAGFALGRVIPTQSPFSILEGKPK